jgi:hypothetical protein
VVIVIIRIEKWSDPFGIYNTLLLPRGGSGVPLVKTMIRLFCAFSSSTQLVGCTVHEVGLVLSYDVEYGLLSSVADRPGYLEQMEIQGNFRKFYWM